MSHSLRFLFLLLLVAGAFFCADLVPVEIRSLSYTISLFIKEVLVFILPLIVFSIVFHSTGQLRGGSAVRTTLLLIAMVLLSNTLSVGVAHVMSTVVTSAGGNVAVSGGTLGSEALKAYGSFNLPSIISCAKALAFGVLSGIVLPKMFGSRALKVSQSLYDASVFILEKIFAPLLPIFVVGFAFKLRSDGALDIIARNYQVMLYIFVPALAHTLFLYFVSSGCSVEKTIVLLKNMLPAAITGFASMSSLLTMPITLSAVKKSTNNDSAADIAVPGSVNVHLVGDCFFTVILLSLMAAAFGKTELITTSDYLHFLVYVVLMKFAEAAVAGTGLILMFPAMEQYLHFTPAMLSLSTTLCILLDPLITSINVLGNGAFSILFVRANQLLFRSERGSWSDKEDSK